MKLKDQVVSFELARKLKELEVKQESLFGYDANGNLMDDKETELARRIPIEVISAFTVAELGEMLPPRFTPNRQSYEIFYSLKYSSKWRSGWLAEYRVAPYGAVRVSKSAATEADARAKLLVHLIEKKLILPPLK